MSSSEGKSAVLTEEMREKFRQTWKIDHLKKHQELALATIILEKRECLICVPTGGGKSLCFEAITTLSDMTREQAAMPEAEAEECRSTAATVLVISPLVFLMSVMVVFQGVCRTHHAWRCGLGERQSWVKCLVQEHNVAAAGSDGSSLPTQSHFTETPGDQAFALPSGFESPTLLIASHARYRLSHRATT